MKVANWSRNRLCLELKQTHSKVCSWPHLLFSGLLITVAERTTTVEPSILPNLSFSVLHRLHRKLRKVVDGNLFPIFDVCHCLCNFNLLISLVRSRNLIKSWNTCFLLPGFRLQSLPHWTCMNGWTSKFWYCNRSCNHWLGKCRQFSWFRPFFPDSPSHSFLRPILIWGPASRCFPLQFQSPAACTPFYLHLTTYQMT